MPAKDWFLIVSFRTELLTEYAIQTGYAKKMGKLLGIQFNFNDRKIVDNDIYGAGREFAEFTKLIESDYRKLIPGFFKKIKETSHEFINTAKEISGLDLKNMPNQGLSREFMRFYDSYQDAVCLIGVPVPCEMTLKKIIQDELAKYIEPHTSQKEFEEAIILFGSTDKTTAIMKEKIGLAALAEKIKADKELTNAFKTKKASEIMKILAVKHKELLNQLGGHVRRFSWLTKTLFQGEEYSLEMAVERIQKAVESKDGLKKYRQGLSDDEKRLAMLAKKHNFSKEFLSDVALSRELTFFRTARLEWLNEGCHYALPLIQEIDSRLKLSKEQVIYCMPQEIIDALSSAKPVDAGNINERIKKYALVMEDGKEPVLFTGDAVNQLKTGKEAMQLNELRGMAASKGLAVGIACIVKDRDGLHKVKNGDILVARLTTPDFVIAMERAAAIVTDLGGITSHAAIISRELGIPCIVGTQQATTAFKNNDLLFIDANQGIVRKIGPEEFEHIKKDLGGKNA